MRDTSENRISAIGIKAQADETKFLTVVGHELGEKGPFEPEVLCRWARKLKPDGAICARFRITKINEQDVHRLREFVQGVLN